MAKISKSLPQEKQAPSGESLSESAPDVEVRMILADLDFSCENAAEVAAHHAAHFITAIRYRIQKMRERNEAEMSLDVVRSELSLRLRKQARELGEKVTEDGLKALILVDAGIQSAMRRFNSAEEFDEYSKLLVEAYRMKRDCLQVVKSLVADEMSLSQAADRARVSLEQRRTELQKRYPGGE